ILLAPIGGSGRVAASPDGRAIFEATSWALWLSDPSGNPLRDPVQEGPFADALAFYPDGSRLLIGGSFGPLARSIPCGEMVEAPDWGQFAQDYNGVAISPDGSLVATAEQGGISASSRLRRGRPSRTSRRQASAASASRFLPTASSSPPWAPLSTRS